MRRPKTIPAATPGQTSGRIRTARIKQAADRRNSKTVCRNVICHLAILLPAIWISFSSEAIAEPQVATREGTSISCEHEIAVAARRYDIPLAVFYAVGLNETGAHGRLQPYSMNIDGRADVNGSLGAAVTHFRQAKAAGAKMIDIGCMQINHHYHSAHFDSLEAMFDPARNVDYAARFLRELKQRETTWTMAVARYNAGPNNNPAQKKYVCGVLTKMVASGFGAWTESARNFCFTDHIAKAPL